jgi:predicted phage tail protein
MTQLVAGGGGCFPGHVLISTPEGEVRLDSVKIGDEVICFGDDKKLLVSKVVKVHEHTEQTNIYHIWGDTKLEATPNHWVLNQFNAFALIDTLGPDDCLVDIRGHLRPIVKKEPGSLCKVYNLTVEGSHTFIANNIRVHNAGHDFSRPIIGSGGGGKGDGGSYTPTTAPDSLNSAASVKILELIGEGEIEGFPSARSYSKTDSTYYVAMLKDIYLDKTPILASSASPTSPSESDYNFKNAEVSARFGTNNQTHMPGFASAFSEFGVGVVVTKNNPVTRLITNTAADRVRVSITIEALQEFKDNGDIVGASVAYQIQASFGGGAYQVRADENVEGRTGDRYQRDSLIDISGGPFPVSIRVVRVTEDSTNVKLLNEINWTSYTEITDGKFTYPGSALVGIKVNAKDFNSIPVRSFRIRGLKVRIPANASVNENTGRLIYSGTWDGTFQAAVWCSDPVWCLFDLLTDCRYGLGQHVKSRDLDKWAFYSASVYSNGLVSNGLGGQEARFSFNGSIQNQEEAYKVINDMCSVFRAMPYWSAGSLTIAQDSPSDSVYLFNQTNISEDGFQYSGSSLKSRHTAAIVAYLNTESQEQEYVLVEDPEAIEKYGYIPVEMTAFATTSRSQAFRVGEWLLYTEQYETETVTFKTSLDAGVAVRPGQVISISDPLRAGARRGGRITAAGTTYITVDAIQETDVPTNNSPTILVTLQDGTVISKSVSSISGSKIKIVGSFTTLPLVGGAYIYNDNSMSSSSWRVIGIQEEENGVYAVSALSYNSSKYNYVERGNSLVFKDYFPREIPKPSSPTSITSQYVQYTDENGQTQTKLAVSWANDPNAVEYQLRYRLKSS